MASTEEVAAFIAAEFPQTKCAVLEVGKSLAVGEVYLYSQGSNDAVAHVVGTYSIPPRQR
ncbi:hypothetical protein D3C78_1345440 [compost metagenome]